MYNKKTINQSLENIYNTIKVNSYNITQITEDVNYPSSNIKNANFEGLTKECFISSISQLSSDINKLKDYTNAIITKENHINNDFKAKLADLQELIDHHNQLVDQLKELQRQLEQAIAERNRLLALRGIEEQ